MSVLNQIAAFGKRGTGNAGAGIGYGLQARNMANQREYRNRLLDIEQRRYDQKRSDMLAERKLAADQLADKQEREYGAGWAQAYFSAPEDKRPMIMQGGIQEAINRGYMSPQEAQAIGEGHMYKLAAASGLDFTAGGSKLPSGVQEFEHLNHIITNPQNYDPETVRAAKIKLQISKKAGTDVAPQVVMIGGVPHIFDKNTQQMSAVTVGGEEVTPESVGDDKGVIASREKEGATTGSNISDMNFEQYDAASAAVGNIAKIDDLINHLETSKAITGAGAELRKNIARAKALLGSKAASGKASDTEILDTMMGSDVFGMIKALGVGARGLDTPAEREFMRSVLTGSIQLNKDTLLRMAEIRRNVSERAINKWNDRVERGELDNFFRDSGITKGPIMFQGVEAGKDDVNNDPLGIR